MDVTMPQLGETVTEGTITKWFKQVGDKVDADEPLFEVSTDKVDSEVPAPQAGFVTEIVVPEGETVPVGARLAVIGEQAGAAPAPGAESAPPAPPAQPPAPPPPAAAPAPPPAPSSEAQPAPRTAAPAGTAGPAGARTATAAGGGARVRAAERRHAGDVAGRAPSHRPSKGSTRRRSAAPAKAVASRATTSSRRRAPAGPWRRPRPRRRRRRPCPRPRPRLRRFRAGTGDEVVPFDNIRRRTAEHMVRSLATSAHVYTSVRVDFERVERVRRAHQAAWRAEEGFSLTYLPFIARAFCDVVHEYPNVNASVDGETLIVHRDINLGIAVDLEFKGLIAPVIRNADGKRLRLDRP